MEDTGVFPGRFLIKVDVPGIDPKNLEVTMENGVLSISGERKSEKESGDENHRLRECAYGAFERRFSLPTTADESKVSAKSSHGVLAITIGKKRQPKYEIRQFHSKIPPCDYRVARRYCLLL